MSPATHHRRTGVFESSPSPSTYAQKTVAGMAPSARIGSIVAGVLSAVVLVGAVLIWRFRVWNKQRSLRTSALLESTISRDKNTYTYFGQEKVDLASSLYVEKPKAVYSSDPGLSDSQIGWSPQVISYRGVQMTPKQLAAIKSSPKKYANWEKSLQLSRKQSPPPINDPTKPTFPLKSKSGTLLPSGISSSESLPSPSRSTSFTSQMYKSTESLSKQTVQLMKVVNTFLPKRDDEIPITIGETVRLVEEYQDGWCFIQRKDSRSGVVPRFCLVDRPSSVSRSGSTSGSPF